MEAQPVLSPEIQRRIERVCACLTTPVVEKEDPHACQTLQDRMVADRVSGVSIAVIHNGDIEWAQGFGVVRLGGTPVAAETLFQAGSISKPVAAMATGSSAPIAVGRVGSQSSFWCSLPHRSRCVKDWWSLYL
jgi:hypothetical protein